MPIVLFCFSDSRSFEYWNGMLSHGSLSICLFSLIYFSLSSECVFSIDLSLNSLNFFLLLSQICYWNWPFSDFFHIYYCVFHLHNFLGFCLFAASVSLPTKYPATFIALKIFQVLSFKTQPSAYTKLDMVFHFYF